MGGFSPWHLLVVAIVAAILFFGWKQLPDMARSVGRSLRVFKTEIKGMNEDDKARDSAKDAADDGRADTVVPKQIEPPAERPTPRADVVPNPAAQTARSRPRPAPSPNGRGGNR